MLLRFLFDTLSRTIALVASVTPLAVIVRGYLAYSVTDAIKQIDYHNAGTVRGFDAPAR